jgi:hypothetical protein
VSEWWTYRLSSFLMFSPRTYARLVEQTNADMWPLQVPAVALGLAALVLAWRARPVWQGRIVWALLAGAWLWVAWAFLHRRFVPINWAAEYVAWAWGVQGLALAWVGVLRGRLDGHSRGDTPNQAHHGIQAPPSTDLARALGAAIVAAALLAWPLLGRLSGGTWASAQSFAVMPDPTALATLGFLLLAPRPPGWLFAVPVLSCALGGALSWALQAPLAWLAPALAACAVACAWRCQQARPASAVP